MDIIGTILFGLLSVIALLAAVSSITGKHTLASLIASLFSMISIAVS